MKIVLNEHEYELREGRFVTREPLDEFPEHLRLTGQQERGGRVLMSNWWIENFESGFGCEKMDINSERQKSSFWDSEVDTSIRGQTCLPAKSQMASVGLGASYFPRWLYNYGGSLYGLNVNATGAYYRSRYVGTWVAEASGQLPRSAYSEDPCRVAPNLTYEGGAAHFLWTALESNGTTQIYYDYGLVPNPSISATWKAEVLSKYGTNFSLISAHKCPVSKFWSLIGGLPTSNFLRLFNTKGSIIGEADFPVGAIRNSIPFLGQDGYEGLFLFYPNQVTCIEDIQSLNSTTSTLVETPYINLMGADDENNAREVVVFSNYLIFPVQDSLLAYAANGEIIDIGLNAFEGLPEAKVGKVVNLCSSMRQLYAGIFGAGKTCIYKFDGIGWHWVGRTASVGTVASIYILSHLGDDAIWHAGNIGTLTHFDYPFVNPLHCAGYSFETTATITLPQFDGGMPNMKGVAFGFAVDGDFNASKTLGIHFGVDGGDPTFYIGEASQSGLNYFQIGGGLGATHTRFQPKFVLKGTATQSPNFRSAVLEYLKFPPTRETFAFDVDLVKTASANLQSVKALTEQLLTARDSLNLIPFQYGSWATTYLKILRMTGLEEIVTAVDSVYATTGMAAVVAIKGMELGSE